MKQIYVNGCSFTKDIYVSQVLGDKLYSDYLSEHYGIPVINRGMPGSCNRRIIRTTARDCLSLDKDTFVIVQLTFLQRFQVSADSNVWQVSENFDPGQEEILRSVKLNDPSNTKQVSDYINSVIRNFSEESLFEELILDVLLLTQLLKNKGINYIIYSHPQLINIVNNNNTFYRTLSKDCGVVDLAKSVAHMFNKIEYYYDDLFEHFNQNGHYENAQYLIDLIDSTNKRN